MNTDNSLPWRADHSRMGFGSRIWDSEGSLACDVDNASLEPEENRARAEFIVRAANNHDELLNVAHVIADYCFMEVGAWKEGDPIGAVYRAAVDAIANAQPKERSES